MNDTDLSLQLKSGVTITQGSAEIDNIENILTQAKLIRDAMKTITVTESTVKSNKKLLAELNKAFNNIDRARKDAKKKYMEPFAVIDSQIKELKGIVDEASDSVRSQIRSLEEIDRDKKLDDIKGIWDKRIQKAHMKSYIKFEYFIEPRHLNKSVSLNKVEKEMASYIDRTDHDLLALKTFTDTMGFDADEAIKIYLDNNSVSSVISDLQREYEAKKVHEEPKETPRVEPVLEPEYFKFYVNSYDAEKAVSLLLQNNIQVFTEE